MRINFLTTNQVKFENAERFFDQFNNYELVQHSIETPEIQDASCEAIAAFSAVWAAKQLGEPCVKMDVGFYITALNGFPGPFVKYINEWLSDEQLIKLMENERNREAYYIDALAIGYPDGSSETFTFKTQGKITTQALSSNSKWPVDSIFIPNGYDMPLGSMDDTQQNHVWGGGVWPQLVDYLSKRNI